MMIFAGCIIQFIQLCVTCCYGERVKEAGSVLRCRESIDLLKTVPVFVCEQPGTVGAGSHAGIFSECSAEMII